MNFSSAFIHSISVHYVGNKSLDQHMILSNEPLELDSLLALKLKDYFLNRFVNVYERYQFTHSSSLQFNEVYTFSKSVFAAEVDTHEVSIEIAKQLFEHSSHPKIKDGELYICHFKQCELDGKSADAFGIFKTETKSGFLEIDKTGNHFDLQYKEGIDLNKLDKGCLIFNVNPSEGFEVSIVDNQNRGEEAHFWKELFLGLKPKVNSYHQTHQLLSITKNYITEHISEDFEITKADKIDLLNRSVDYFKSHETFDKNEFEHEVLQDETVIKSFQKFDLIYRTEHSIQLEDQFEISSPAVKKQARVFKSVLKLDKNFHIYIHGDRELIEQGKDADGRKYYKIYFEEES